MSKKFPLDPLALEIRDHWKTYRPKMFRELVLEGRLDQALYEASERTGRAFGELVEAGLEAQAAWEAVRGDWAFLRAEPDPCDDESEGA